MSTPSFPAESQLKPLVLGGQDFASEANPSSCPTPDWSPFVVTPRGERGDPTRSIRMKEGIGDRLRAAAFAEIQAREAFNWAADELPDAPDALRTAWKSLAHAEDRHLSWLLNRMKELDIPVEDRRVSDQLWVSLRSCQNAKEFALYMASAEDRGRQAGERFYKDLLSIDPVSAEIFGKIAEEEVEHIRLASKYFPDAPRIVLTGPPSGWKLERPVR